MTEVPEHLLQRSRDRRRAMGLAVEGDAPAAAGGDAPAAAPAAATPAVAAAKAPVAIPAAAPPAPPPPDPPWVEVAKTRQKIPYWVMPVLLFLPIWLVMYVGTLEEPTREEGVLYEGGLVYVESGCSNCHGGGGAGGTGPAFTNETIIETFSRVESQVAWVVHGSQGYVDAGFTAYGDTDKQITGFNGSLMPAFGADLTAEELVAVVFYERVELGGFEAELELAELVWEQIENGEIALPEHFAEGPDGDFEDEIAVFFEEVRLQLEDSDLVAVE